MVVMIEMIMAMMKLPMMMVKMIEIFATNYDDHDHGYGGGYNDDGDDDDDDDDDGDDDLLWWLAVQVLLRRILTPFRVPLFT